MAALEASLAEAKSRSESGNARQTPPRKTHPGHKAAVRKRKSAPHKA